DDMPIENKLVSSSIEKSQMRVEGYNFDMRKHLVEYDDVMNKQRETIYKKRKGILLLSEGEKFENYENLSEYVLELIETEINEIVSFHTASDHGTVWNINEIFESIKTIYPLSDEEIEKFNELMEKDEKDEKLAEAQKRTNIIEYFSNLAKIKYEELKTRISKIEGIENIKNPIGEIEKGILLRSIDSLWIEHLDNIDHLRAGIGLRGYAQTDPLVEYKRETYQLFVELLNNIEKQVVYSIYKVMPAINLVAPTKNNVSVVTNDPTESKQFGLVQSITQEGVANQESHNVSTLKNDEVKKYGTKIGRNDTCPCGSGKKYKKCCGKDE
ncbi:MAG TPA: SEC-C metal-binding domain-containing protein, partial [bacterium]|nr:SEC-C metal-binding domain-containing protein [bacterium]